MHYDSYHSGVLQQANCAHHPHMVAAKPVQTGSANRQRIAVLMISSQGNPPILFFFLREHAGEVHQFFLAL